MLRLLAMHRRFIVTGMLVFFSLGFLLFFKENESFSPVLQGFIVGVAFFLVIPLLYSKMVIGEPIQNLGLQKGRFISGVLAVLLALIVACGIELGLVLMFPLFHEQYVFPGIVQTSFLWFIFYEIVLSSIVLSLYEVFFRGLIQSLWLKSFGIWAVVMQTAFFYGFFLLKGDFSWYKAPLLIFCPFAGYIAYRSHSLWYSFVASWIFIFLTDIFFLMYR